MDPFRALGDLLQQNAQRFVTNLRQAGDRAAEALARAAMPQPQPAAATLLASVSARHGAAAVAAQPLFDLAFNPEEIKARLNAVPVYTVVNNKNEFVLVAGEGADRQLGLFFFSEPEAQAMLKKIKQVNPQLGKQAKVLTTSMDRVYDFATTPRSNTDTAGVSFRFVPDPQQVQAALELYRHAGVPANGFQGVPLFQAEGLTIRGEKERYTPLFFSKDDLDVALSAAFSSKEAAAQADTRAKAERARSELQEANSEVRGLTAEKGENLLQEVADDARQLAVELASAASERERKAAQRKAEQAEQRLQKYEQRLAEVAAQQKLPRVDVGSLEEVISRMEADEKGDWGDVVFVPAKSVAGAAGNGK